MPKSIGIVFFKSAKDYRYAKEHAVHAL